MSYIKRWNGSPDDSQLEQADYLLDLFERQNENLKNCEKGFIAIAFDSGYVCVFEETKKQEKLITDKKKDILFTLNAPIIETFNLFKKGRRSEVGNF